MKEKQKEKQKEQENQKEQEQDKQLEQEHEKHQEQEKQQEQKEGVFTEVIVECGGEKVNMSDNSDIRSEQMDSKSENIGDKVQFIEKCQRNSE